MSLIAFLPILIISGGLFVIVRLRAFFIFHPIRTLKATMTALGTREARSSLFLALAGTLGIGNIVGVAVGIATGGAGSVFWLFVSSVFASALKYAESSLASDMHAEASDGMMSVIRLSFPCLGRPLSRVYAAACVLLSLVMGAALQSSGVISSVASLSIPPLATGILFALAVFAVIIFGAERVGFFTALIIPATTVVYIILALITVFSAPHRIPGVITTIVNSAVSPAATSGGLLGFFTSTAIREGFSRGLLSNEAGAGTSSLAHSRVDHSPSSAGLLGMCEVFFDTVLLCPLTALAILVSIPDPSSYASGMSLILASVGATLGGLSSTLVVICIISFAFSTVICWYCYGSRCLSYLGVKGGAVYMVIYLASTMLGVFLSDTVFITASDYILFILVVLTTAAIIKKSDRLVYLSENAGLLGYTK